MLQKAQEYLNKGYSVIPVGTDKKPLIKWTEYQTRKAEETEVQQWLQQFPNMQLGIVTGAISDLVVIDVEEGGDHTQFPETLTATTGGNGYHLYYKHPGTPVKNGVRVMDLVDIRGDGGYVVAPGSSSTKGAYDWVEEATEPALYTGDVLQSQPEMSLETGELVQTGERNVLATKKAGEILAKLPTKAQREEAWERLQEWNQLNLIQPLEDTELRKLFESIATREDKSSDGVDIKLEPLTLQQLYDLEFPPIKWLAKDLVPAGMMGAITGESNSYKSFVTLALAQSVATGTPYLGHFAVEQQGKVLIVDEENDLRLIEKRFRDMGVEPHENIIFLSRPGVRLDNYKHMEALLKVVEEINPVLVVLDSLVRFHSKDENSATEMSKVTRAIGTLTSQERSVVFIHHHKKEQAGSKNSGTNSVRGSTDIFASLDFHLGIKKNSDGLTVHQHKLRVQQELPAFNVGLECGITNSDIAFKYGGVDTSRQDQMEEIMESMKTMLFEAAGEEIGRKELIDGSEASNKQGAEALKKLLANEVISYRVGAHGAHFYTYGPQIEEPSLDELETMDEDDINN
jgi:hypothetical protein